MKDAGSLVVKQPELDEIVAPLVVHGSLPKSQSTVSIPPMLAVLQAVLVLLSFLPHSLAEEPQWRSWRDSPKQFQWKGAIKGEPVEMMITSDVFEKAAHKMREKDGIITSVDGYQTYCDPSGDAVLPHIQEWHIKWGGKDVVIPKGIYTSVFLPYLRSPKPKDDAFYRDSSVLVGESKDGNALYVMMNCGEDGVTYRIAFTITKAGKARRVTLEVRS